MIRAALAPHRAIVRATGADVARLLNDLITVEVADLAPGRARHAALLTPQGKLQFEFFIVKDRAGYLIDVAEAQASALASKLTTYVLRSDAAFALAGDAFSVALAWGEDEDATPDNPPGLTYRDPRDDALGWRIIAPPHDLNEWLEVASAEGSLAGHAAHRVSLGVPEGGIDFTADDFPHDALFDRLHGVDFDKGCFVGQEVVSRMKHRGTARKRVVPVRIEGEAETGADITLDGRVVGRLGTVAGATGLAMLRLDKLEPDADLVAGSARLTAEVPTWMAREG